MKVFNLISVLLIAAVSSVSGYRNGAPEESYRACQLMQPGHGFEPQTRSLPPVEIMVNTTRINCGDPVMLTLRMATPNNRSSRLVTDGVASEIDFFRGFIIQARDVSRRDVRLGRFELLPLQTDVQLMDCIDGQDNSVTHANNADKSEISVVWRSPNNYDGTVFFRYSVVQTFEKFWTGLASQRITITNPALEEPTEDIVEQGTEDNTQADDVE